MPKVDGNQVLDYLEVFMDEKGLQDNQQIATLLREIEAEMEADEESDEDDFEADDEADDEED